MSASAKRPSLDALFAPRAVAVVGASEREGSVGRQLLANLLGSPFGGVLYPVNPGRRSVLGVPAHASVEALPEPPDLALIATPAAEVPGVVEACGRAGVRTVVVLADGFGETGPDGAARERRLVETARQAGLRLLGPSSLGVMRPPTGLNATFAPTAGQSGSVALFSQSGALLSAMLAWGRRENVGFSLVAGLGQMADIGWADLLDYAAADARTESVLLYLRTVGDARALLSAAREVAFQKPILVLKAEQHAPEHAPPLLGLPLSPDEALEAALRRTGVLRVETIAGLFHLAETLAKQPRPRGPRLSVVANAGGPARLAADALRAAGGVLASPSEAFREALEPGWDGPNPLDLPHDAGPEAFARALALAAADDASDGLLAILAPQPGLDPVAVADALARLEAPGRPLLASWMGAAEVAEAEARLNGAGIPTFAFPDAAARAFAATWRYAETLRLLYETPTLPDDADGLPDRDAAARLLAAALAEGRTALLEHEARALCAAYGLLSPDDKPQGSDPDLPQPLPIPLRLGMAPDAAFGPVLVFGVGGLLGGALGEHTLGLPPLTTTLARRMTERTRVAAALDPYPGLRDALDRLLVRFAQCVAEQPRLRAFALDPLMVTPDGRFAGTPRVLIYGPDVPDEALPRPAIRPYPQHLVEPVTLADGTPALVRPIRPEDEPLVARLHEALDEETVYLRYASFFKLEGRTDHARLARKCFIDYDREMALVVEAATPEGPRLLGIGRLTRVPGPEPDTHDGEFGLLVADDAQRLGIGTLLLERLVRHGRAEGYARIVADVLRQNRGMQRVAEKLGFTTIRPEDFADPMLRVERDLRTG